MNTYINLVPSTDLIQEYDWRLTEEQIETEAFYYARDYGKSKFRFTYARDLLQAKQQLLHSRVIAVKQ